MGSSDGQQPASSRQRAPEQREKSRDVSRHRFRRPDEVAAAFRFLLQAKVVSSIASVSTT